MRHIRRNTLCSCFVQDDALCLSKAACRKLRVESCCIALPATGCMVRRKPQPRPQLWHEPLAEGLSRLAALEERPTSLTERGGSEGAAALVSEPSKNGDTAPGHQASRSRQRQYAVPRPRPGARKCCLSSANNGAPCHPLAERPAAPECFHDVRRRAGVRIYPTDPAIMLKRSAPEPPRIGWQARPSRQCAR